jgi:DNA uptake protein ComE-like DNA-binding protein
MGTGAPLNLNKATAGEMVEQLGVTKDVAEKIVSNRPYRLKGELVAKNVVPKETYDVIKDRVTVSP